MKRPLIGKTPDQLELPFALWTRDAVKLLIKQRFGIGNLRAHHSKKPQKWLEQHKEQVEVFFLPSYSTELNPDEYLNGNLKNKVHSGTPIRNREDLEKKTRSFMRTLIKRSDCLCGSSAPRVCD